MRLTLSFLIVLSVSAAFAQDAAKPLTFGSQTILQTLWSATALQGKPADRKIRHLRVPDRSPPTRETPLEPLPPLPEALQGSIRRVKPYPDQKPIALSFDLCEQANEVTGYDAAIVNTLRRLGVKATFFAGGKWMRSHPEQTMQLMADPLFEIGNHAWTHGNFARLDQGEMQQQLLRTQAQYELLWEQLRDRTLAAQLDPQEMARIPRQPALFRPPYGRCSTEALAVTAQLGLPAIQWDVVSADPMPSQTPAKLTRTVLSQAKPGSIVIFHANGRGYNTAASLPAIIDALRERGYAFVTVSELLHAGEVISVPACYELKPGDNARYDRLFGKGTGE